MPINVELKLQENDIAFAVNDLVKSIKRIGSTKFEDSILFYYLKLIMFQTLFIHAVKLDSLSLFLRNTIFVNIFSTKNTATNIP